MAAWQGIEALKQTIDFPATPSFFSSKKWTSGVIVLPIEKMNQINTKNYWK